MKNFISIITVLLVQFSFGQKNLDGLLKKLNTESVPYISVDALKNDMNNVFLLDSREPKEFEVSHLDKAICVGYNKFKLKETLKQLPEDKNAKIVVYCSLGVRSEDIAEKIKKAGYTNVYNLYGGIFEWKNKDNKVVNQEDKITEEVHAFDKNWGKWLTKGTKVYD